MLRITIKVAPRQRYASQRISIRPSVKMESATYLPSKSRMTALFRLLLVTPKKVPVDFALIAPFPYDFKRRPSGSKNALRATVAG
jgi:hypothetical protein